MRIIRSLPILALLAGCAGSGGGGVTPQPPGAPGAPHTVMAAASAQPITIPSGVISIAGPNNQALSTRLSVQGGPGIGWIFVFLNAQTTVNGGPAKVGQFVQAVGPGTTHTSENPATYVTLWPSAPATLTASGTIVQATPYGFTLNVDATHTAVPVVLSSNTTASGAPMVAGGAATVTGAGSTDRAIVATSVTVPFPTATPTPISLPNGGTVGQDDAFTPNDGDSASGGNGQVVDGLACNPTMDETHYHVHAWLGILVNGKQIAVPDGVGMKNPGPDNANGITGFTNSATCFYFLHTHNATGMIHVESSSTAPVSSSVYTLGNLLDVWGQSVTANGVGPFPGMVRVFVATVPLKQTLASNYTEFTGDPTQIQLFSHEAIWLEVGPTYVTPPNLPAINFPTEF